MKFKYRGHITWEWHLYMRIVRINCSHWIKTKDEIKTQNLKSHYVSLFFQFPQKVVTFLSSIVNAFVGDGESTAEEKDWNLVDCRWTSNSSLCIHENAKILFTISEISLKLKQLNWRKINGTHREERKVVSSNWSIMLIQEYI